MPLPRVSLREAPHNKCGVTKQSQVIMPAEAGILRGNRRDTEPLSQMNGFANQKINETTSLFLKLLRPCGLAIFFEIATGLKPLAMTESAVVSSPALPVRG